MTGALPARRLGNGRRPAAGSLLLAAFLWVGLPAPGPAIAAEPCSIESMGPPAYELVKRQLEARFVKSPDVTIEPYQKAETNLLPQCVIELRGRFQILVKGVLKRRAYEARAKRKEGAPMGLEILKLAVMTP